MVPLLYTYHHIPLQAAYYIYASLYLVASSYYIRICMLYTCARRAEHDRYPSSQKKKHTPKPAMCFGIRISFLFFLQAAQKKLKILYKLRKEMGVVPHYSTRLHFTAYQLLVRLLY